MIRILQLLKKRRSIRKYKEDKLTSAEIDQLIKAVLLSPSSRNRRPWEFICVDDRNLLKELSQSKQSGSAFLEDAAMGIIVLADPHENDVWVEDTSIAAIILQLTAQSLNLGSCWIQIRGRYHGPAVTSEEYVKKVLEIPGKYRVESIIAIGHPAENKPPHDEGQLEYRKVHIGHFGNHYR